jgi:hypothetical protein
MTCDGFETACMVDWWLNVQGPETGCCHGVLCRWRQGHAHCGFLCYGFEVGTASVGEAMLTFVGAYVRMVMLVTGE